MLTFIPGVLAVGLAWKFKGFGTAAYVLLVWMLLEMLVGVFLLDLPR